MDSFNQKFKVQLKRSESQELAQKLVKFVYKIQKNRVLKDELINCVSQFLVSFEQQFLEVWNVDYDIGEAIEGIVTRAAYDKLMSIYSAQKDIQSEFLIRVFDFIQPHHFECDKDLIIEQSFVKAIQYIQKINEFKTPRDKMIAIANACKIISAMVQESSLKKEHATGADEFLPVLIYTVIKARPNNPFSNVQFIKDFRAQQRRKGLEEYYFTAYESALEFIEQIDDQKLIIPQVEYNILYKKYFDIAKSELSNDERWNLIDQNDQQSNQFEEIVRYDGKETEMSDLNAIQLIYIQQQIFNLSQDFQKHLPQNFLKYENIDFEDLKAINTKDLYLEYQYLIQQLNQMNKQIISLQKKLLN